MKQMERNFNWFLGLLIFSLVGNACADFAILWHCVGKISGGSAPGSSSHFVTAFYFGQAAGAICLAPVLSVWVDRHGRRFSSILLDATYALVLCLMLATNEVGILTPALLFPFGAITASLGALHRGAIGYGAVKIVAEHLNLTKLVAKFNAAIFTTNLLGSLISGLLFRYFGLNGCLIIAIVTFLPMPIIYLKLFSKEDGAANAQPAPRRKVFSEVKAGLTLITEDRRLWVNSLVVAIWNVASNIFPAIVAISFQKIYPGRTDYASIAVALAILAGVFAFGPMEKVAKTLSLNRIMLYALSPAIAALVLCVFSASPFAMALAFLLHCVGASLVNIASGSLRVSSVPKTFVGRVNTAHSALVACGQVFGSVALVPVLSASIVSGAGMILAAYVLSAGLAWALFPNISLEKAIEGTR